MSHEPTGRERAEHSQVTLRVFGDDLVVDKTDVDDLPNPFEKMKEQGAIATALGKSNNRASVVFDCSVPADDVDGDDAPLDKGLMIRKPEPEGPNTLRKKLGIVRSEQITTADGDMSLHGFDANNQLVDARLLRCAAE